MTGPRLLLAAFALAAGRAAAQAPGPSPSSSPEPPRFAAQVHVITVDVLVLDKKGRPVPGLTRADFELREDGAPQEIATFDAVQVSGPAESGAAPSGATTGAGARGRALVVVIDDLHLSPLAATQVKEAVGSFLRQGAQDGDVVTLVSTAKGTGARTRMPDGQAVLDRFPRSGGSSDSFPRTARRSASPNAKPNGCTCTRTRRCSPA